MSISGIVGEASSFIDKGNEEDKKDKDDWRFDIPV